MIMRILLIFFIILSVNIPCLAVPEFTSKEVISYFNRSYEQAKNDLLKKGYKFKEKFERFYTFQKIKSGIKYKCTLTVKNNKVEGISIDEYYNDYLAVIEDIQNEGFIFEKSVEIKYPSGETEEFDEVPSEPIASSLTKFDKANRYICTVICPFNLGRGTNSISVNYGKYTNK